MKLVLPRWALVIVGVLAIGLGTAGIFLPVLPSTPFFLLAAACFVRSSDRLYKWLISHKGFGPYLRNYREHRAITLPAKIVTLILLWGTIGYTIFVMDALALRVLLLVIACGVTLHIVRLKTMSSKATPNTDMTPVAEESTCE